jgi:hypothetical protein
MKFWEGITAIVSNTTTTEDDVFNSYLSRKPQHAYCLSVTEERYSGVF